MNGFSGIRPRKQVQPAPISQGGTGATTRVEAVEALGVPTLDGDNTFTGGMNIFPQINAVTVAVSGDLSAGGRVAFPGGMLTVGTDELHFPSAFVTFTLPATSGTLALVGDPIQWPYKAQGSVYTASRTDGVINCSGTFTVTLPTAVGFSGQVYVVKNSGVGVVTVAGTGGQTFDGAASVVLAAGGVTRVCSDGANWLII